MEYFFPPLPSPPLPSSLFSSSFLAEEKQEKNPSGSGEMAKWVKYLLCKQYDRDIAKFSIVPVPGRCWTEQIPGAH